MSSIYSLYIQPYYNSISEQYINIITINKPPTGPLAKYVTNIRFNKLSDFSGFSTSCKPLCMYAIKNISSPQCNNLDLLSPENVDDLISYLIENNYNVNKDLTKIMNNDKIYLNNGKKLLFYINYN